MRFTADLWTTASKTHKIVVMRQNSDHPRLPGVPGKRRRAAAGVPADVALAVWKLADRFSRTIKATAPSDLKNAVSLACRQIAKGAYTADELQRAIDVFAADEYWQGLDPRARPGILKFFSAESIAAWQTPFRRKRDGALSALDRLQVSNVTVSQPAAPMVEDHDDDTNDFAL